MFGLNQRLVLRCECDTVLPADGLRPVTWQALLIGAEVSARCALSLTSNHFLFLRVISELPVYDSNPVPSEHGKPKNKPDYRNTPVTRAAGGVVLHEGKVLVVHRPRYDDWSLPKGHVKKRETWSQAALREVFEETGVTTEVLGEPYPVSYLVDDHLPKVVMFYPMSCNSDPAELCGDPDEVDQVQWWDIADALQRLDYEVECDALVTLSAEPVGSHSKQRRH